MSTVPSTPELPLSESSRPVIILLLVWLAAAIVLGLSGIFQGAPAPVIGATNLVLILSTLFALFQIPGLKAWMQSVAIRYLILYHVVRFVGIAFLVMYNNGTIPGAFAVTAGWGDIAVAVLAIPVAFLATPVVTNRRRLVVLAWNVFGLLDILLVLFNGMRLGLSDINQMVWITEFPMSLLPTFIVPLVIVSHIVIFVRLRSTPTQV